MSKSKDYNELIHTVRWLRLRKQTLTAHPLCQRCEAEGRISAATDVHHVVPCEYAINRTAMEQLMFDPGNLMALCHDCHVQVHRELGRSGKAATKRINEARRAAAVEKFFGG